MSELLVLSFDSLASPVIHLKGIDPDRQQRQPYGWGMAWYPSGDNAAMVIKDPTSIGRNAMTQVLTEWRRFSSCTFVAHIIGAAKRRSQQDTHPFVRAYAGRSWIMTHNGDLTDDYAKGLPLDDGPLFHPLGRSDSEHAFCWLLQRIHSVGARNIQEAGFDRLHQWFQEINALGTANLVLSDGLDTVVYRDRQGFNGLHWIRRTPPHPTAALESRLMSLSLDEPPYESRTSVVFSSEPLSDDEGWAAMGHGQMIATRRGAITWDTEMHGRDQEPAAPVVATPKTQQPTEMPMSAESNRASSSGRRRPSPEADAPKVQQGPTSRILTVVHETEYEYAKPIELSRHLLRLQPVLDEQQQVLEHSLLIEPECLRTDFEDVFGNRATRLEVEGSYHEIKFVSTSKVRLVAPSDLSQAYGHRRSTIPLAWMPWQREMMHPYLLSPELPETQLEELWHYAMSFVERQEYDLVETLYDMNTTLYQDYEYVPGSTQLETTPFEVYVQRKGVCQDFANLFICLARLLNIPARYRVGYIFTGADYDNKLQSEASHAWAELYLPGIGWRGFDPTNGCLAGLDHVRVACGRNYVDATPTSGTIYRGGGGEVLRTTVRVEEA
ncbi:MAG: class II glutamine amidotransferase [Bradymonadia bacterium]